MLASELIRALQEQVIDRHGDMEVTGGLKDAAIDELQVSMVPGTLTRVRLIRSQPVSIQVKRLCRCCGTYADAKSFVDRGLTGQVCPKCDKEIREYDINRRRALSVACETHSKEIARLERESEQQRTEWLKMRRDEAAKVNPVLGEMVQSGDSVAE